MSAENSAPVVVPEDHGIEPGKKPVEAQSAFGASTLMTDVEKQQPSQVAPGPNKRPTTLFGAPVDTAAEETGADRLYGSKAQLLNEALLDIGMGRYQWIMFLATSVGWFLDSFWVTSFTVILPAATNEAQFFYSMQNPTNLMVSAFVGLALGALAWPILSDYVGRKQMFTSTVVLMAMAGLVGAGMSGFVGLCVVGFVVGFAVGGNQSVDAMLLLESLPASHQWLVTMQAVFWGVGELVANAVGYAFIELYTCGTGPDEDTTFSPSSKRAHSSSSSSISCHYVSNKGWRYTWWCFGCITLFLYLLRFSFRMYETPKSLLARRRDAEAVQTTRDIAHASKQITWLGESSFARVDTMMITEEAEEEAEDLARPSRPTGARSPRAIAASVVSTLGPLGLCLLVFAWATLGLTFPLHRQFLQPYLSTKGVSEVTATTVTRPYLFTRYIYVSICGIPGPAVAALLIETRALGRRRAGALLSLLAGVFMLAAGAARSRGAWLGFECVLSFFEFALMAVATVYTVEVFPAPIRGAGMGAAGFAWRVLGMVAWIVAASTSSTSGAAVWFSGALSVVATAAWVFLPKETRGKAAA